MAPRRFSNPLRTEHETLRDRLADVDRALAGGSLDSMARFLGLLEERLSLYRLEETEILRPALMRRATAREQPFGRAEEEAREEEYRLKELREALRAGRRGESVYQGRLLVDLLRSRIARIGEVILPLAERLLSPKEWEAIGRGFGALSARQAAGGKVLVHP